MNPNWIPKYKTSEIPKVCWLNFKPFMFVDDSNHVNPDLLQFLQELGSYPQPTNPSSAILRNT